MYSGGIGRREDLVALAGLRQVNLAGVIVGKALYERRFTVAEGVAALRPQRSRGLTATGAPAGGAAGQGRVRRRAVRRCRWRAEARQPMSRGKRET